MSVRALAIAAAQVTIAVAICMTIAAVPALRAACTDLALALPASLLVGGVLASVYVRWRVASSRSGVSHAVDLAALPVALVLAIVPLVGAWAGARTHGAFVAGLLPYSDAGNYLGGADRLLADGTLDEWNSRRPLNAVLLAVRLALSGGSLRGALVLQAVLLGASAWLAARAVASSLGRPAGAIVMGTVLVFGAIFVPTTMSECLGLTLGALGFAVLWTAAQRRSALGVAVGSMLLTLALAARSGPFGILPMLLLWAAIKPADVDTRTALDRRNGPAALVGMIGGFAFNTLVLQLHHGARAGTQSNFAYTLYGLVHRGVGWQRAIQDHPEIHGMTDSASGAYIQGLSLRWFRTHPWELVVGLWQNVVCAVDSVTDNASGGALAHHAVAQWVVATCAVAGVVWASVRRLRDARGDRALWLAVAVVTGVALSVPVIYMDGRERVFAAGFPFVAAWSAMLLQGRPSVEAAEAHDDASLGAIAMAIGLMGCALAGVCVVRTRGTLALPGLQCPSGEEPVAIDPRVLPSVNIVARGDSFAPTVVLRDLRRGDRHDPNLGTNTLGPSLRQVTAWMTLVEAYDPRARRINYLVGPAGWADPPPRGVCGVALGPGTWRVLRVTRTER